ncbi:E3 ubiquitin-protein ligase UPL4 [Raphanus sativus]|uniref:E3 ubiquitin-protein ligase UPL4 n=1 Tax=Raphanus sativus TaxID=3726 RepID=A0A6J0LD82_RAPSA|nr:E3 ubiquitin-protein ligase UPL4 [Raphanus sativus]
MEVVEEPPADKRACNSQDFRPSTSGGSSVQAQANGTTGRENTDADMDTSSSASPPSSHSDAEQEREEDEDYGSFSAVLTELCEVLSFCTEDSLSSVMADVLSQVLVKLAKNESNGSECEEVDSAYVTQVPLGVLRLMLMRLVPCQNVYLSKMFYVLFHSRVMFA